MDRIPAVKEEIMYCTCTKEKEIRCVRNVCQLPSMTVFLMYHRHVIMEFWRIKNKSHKMKEQKKLLEINVVNKVKNTIYKSHYIFTQNPQTTRDWKFKIMEIFVQLWNSDTWVQNCTMKTKTEWWKKNLGTQINEEVSWVCGSERLNKLRYQFSQLMYAFIFITV